MYLRRNSVVTGISHCSQLPRWPLKAEVHQQLRAAAFVFSEYFLTFCLFIFWLLWGSQAFSSCGEQGLLSKMRCLGFLRHRLPTAAASLAAEHGVYGTQAQSPGGVWNLPRPGIEPMSPTLVGGLLTTEPQGKSRK